MTIEQTMKDNVKKNQATSECAPFERNTKYTGGHPRPRIGATEKKRNKQQNNTQQQ